MAIGISKSIQNFFLAIFPIIFSIIFINTKNYFAVIFIIIKLVIIIICIFIFFDDNFFDSIIILEFKKSK